MTMGHESLLELLAKLTSHEDQDDDEDDDDDDDDSEFGPEYCVPGTVHWHTREFFVRAINQHPGQAAVVDLGCGWGELTQHLVRDCPNKRFVGVDIDPSRIREAKEKIGCRARLKAADICGRTPLRTGHYQFALMSWVICSLIDDQLAAAACEARRLLKAGGRLLLALGHPCFQIGPEAGIHCESWSSGRRIRFGGRNVGISRSYQHVTDILSQHGLSLTEGFLLESDPDRGPLPLDSLTENSHATLLAFTRQ